MKNELQSQNLLLKVDPRSNFCNNFLQRSARLVFCLERQVDNARGKTRNIDAKLATKQCCVTSWWILYVIFCLSRQWKCALSRIKMIFSVIFSHVLMLLGTGGCYQYMPSSPPFSGHADGSEQTGCGHSKWTSWRWTLISSSSSNSHT